MNSPKESGRGAEPELMRELGRGRRRLAVLAERLAVTEDRYRTLFETLPVGVVHYNADGSILGANPKAGEILGLEIESMISWPFEWTRGAIQEDGSPLRPDDYPVIIALRTGRVVADVVIGQPHARTGELRWLSVTAVPDARDQQGRPQRAYAMVSDITEERRAHAAIREGSRLLGRLRDANVLGVVESTEDGMQDANDAYLDIIGYSRADLEAGRADWHAITPAQWAASDADAVDQLRRTGTLRPYEKEYIHRDGHRVPVVLASAVIDWKPLRWVTFVVDLTARQRREQARAEHDRRELENELRLAERLQTVGQLTSGIAHDFGNLLGVVVGYAELAEEVSGRTDPELHRILGEIRAASDRAVNLIAELLNFSHRSRAEPEPIDLNTLVAGVTDLLSVSLDGGAQIVVDPWPAALPPVLAERGELEQVLLNLAVNARDAMPDGGTLTISTSPADFQGGHPHASQGAHTGRYVELDVSDTGTGMSAGVAGQIFERFFSTKPPGKGTGLGLSTVQGIVSRLGGTIEVDTEAGHGTTFRIFLPAEPDLVG